MRTNTLILLAVLAGMVSAPLVRANEAGLSAQDVVRRYSQTVACQIFEESPSQYVTFQLEPRGDNGFGAVWLVGWTGDLGCMGGNGTQLVHMTLVMQNGFTSLAVSPVVIDAEPMPKLVMGTLLGLSFQDGVVTIRGTTGQQKWGTLKEVTERYRWLGPWGSGPRFKRLS